MAKASVWDDRCGAQQVLDLIANKWTALVIHALEKDVRRYSELQRIIGGISQKMLTQTLRSLEREGLLARKIYPVVPPRVEYQLTPLGRTLLEPLKALCRWAEQHLPELTAARKRHQREQAPATSDRPA